MKPCVIGITGGSGSGKTTVSRNVLEAIGTENVTYIPQDSYYHNLQHLPFEIRSKINFDHPDALDNQLLIHHIRQLKKGETIEKPIYDFTKHIRLPSYEIITPREVILLEGILILAIEELRNLMDIKIFVDAPSDIRLLRRIKRDVQNRGRSLDSVIDQYISTVRPMHQQFIEPSKCYADIVIPEGGNNEVASDMLITKIRAILNQTENGKVGGYLKEKQKI